MREFYAMYTEGSTNLEIRNKCPRNVALEEGETIRYWWYKLGTRFEQGPFRFGQDVREPSSGESKEFWGPAFIGDLDDPEHMERFELFRMEHQNDFPPPEDEPALHSVGC